MATPDRKAAANPTKAFFVRMITRDISLEDCILDLIDNSVDGAWRSEGSRPMGLADDTDLSAYSIHIDADVDRFCIEDDCGGMTLEDAIDHAFSFGRHVEEAHDNYSIGVYGIGMKRAVFKLGNDIRIRTTYEDEKGKTAFAVPIDVQDWLKDDEPPWDFDIVDDEPLKKNGVKIEVENLTNGASTLFGSPAFLQNLRRTIARDYTLHLNRGLSVLLNGEKVSGWQIELRQSDDFAPMRFAYSDEIDGEKVDVEIIGGMTAAPPDDVDPNEEDGERRYGWYVACNGRIVLAADKTTVAGWGTDDWPQWHRQYSGFIGIVLFTAADAVALPLTTTKRSVDVSSEVYRRARTRMREVSRHWIDYTNARKQAREEAKRIEAETKSIAIYDIVPQSSVKLPQLVPQPVERTANVNYSVSRSKLKRLAQELGSVTMSFREVGLKSFEYTYDDFVGDD